MQPNLDREVAVIRYKYIGIRMNIDVSGVYWHHGHHTFFAASGQVSSRAQDRCDATGETMRFSVEARLEGRLLSVAPPSPSLVDGFS